MLMNFFEKLCFLYFMIIDHLENSHSFPNLSVNKGKDVSSTNPQSVNDFRAKRQKQNDAISYFNAIRLGHIPSLSKAITLIESTRPEHQKLASEIVNLCLPYSGNAMRIGITGVPGVGKSTFIETFGLSLVQQGKKIAILAIDPSSEKSKGSILGDKTRMEELVKSPFAFIRPSPSSGTLGGVARKTRESIILCEAAGFNMVLIETVGVGQSEIAVHSMTDFFLLLMLAGAGDELQGIKRGIMEMADGIAITKADGDNLLKAQAAVSEFSNALHLFPPTSSGWIPKVLACSSTENTGIQELGSNIELFFTRQTENGHLQIKRISQSKYWMHENIKALILDDLYRDPKISEQLITIEEQLINQKIDPFKASEIIFEMYRSK